MGRYRQVVARMLRRLARAVGGTTHITVNAPNYVGDKHDLLAAVKAELAKDARRGGSLVAAVARTHPPKGSVMDKVAPYNKAVAAAVVTVAFWVLSGVQSGDWVQTEAVAAALTTLLVWAIPNRDQ